ncbi:hypothetical protein MBLNU457_4626t1 [Dothideomycetes sp. NU457]
MNDFKRKQKHPSSSNKKPKTSIATTQDKRKDVHATEGRSDEAEIADQQVARPSASTKTVQKGKKRVSDQEANDQPLKKARGRPPNNPVVVIEKRAQPTTASPTGGQLRQSNRLYQDTQPASTSKGSASRQKSPQRSRKRKKVLASRRDTPASPEQQSDPAVKALPELGSGDAQTTNEPADVDENEEGQSRSTSRAPPVDQTENHVEQDIPQAGGDDVVEKDPDWQEHNQSDAVAQNQEDQGTQSRSAEFSNDWQHKLGRVFETLKATNTNRPELKTRPAKTLVKACKQFQNQVGSSNSPFLLLDADRDLDDHPPEQLDMVNSWRKIHKKITELESQSGFEITQDLYAHVIPAMTKVLRTVFTKFGRRSTLREEHYDTFLSVIKDIVALGDYGKAFGKNLQQEEHRRMTKLAIIKPVNNGIIAEVKKIQKILERVLRQEKSTTQAAARQQETLTARGLAQHRERRTAEREAILDPWRKRWKVLHDLQLLARLQASEYGGFRASWDVLGKPFPDTKRYTSAEQVADMIPELNDREGESDAWSKAVKVDGVLMRAGGVLMEACRKYLESDQDEADLWKHIVFDLCNPFVKGQRIRTPPPLLEFSVTEIVSREIFARDQLLAGDHLDEEGRAWVKENKVWISRMWDPRVRPRLPGDEVVDDTVPEVIEIEDDGSGEEDEQMDGDHQAEDAGQEAVVDDQEAEDAQDEAEDQEDQAEDGLVED